MLTGYCAHRHCHQALGSVINKPRRRTWTLYISNGRLADKPTTLQLSSMANPAFDYRSLSFADRLELVGDIWDSIAEEANASAEFLPMTDERKAELDRRIATLDSDPGSSLSMDEALARIRSRISHTK